MIPLPKNVNFEINDLHIVQNTDISKQERNFANIGLGRLLTIVLVISAHNKIDFVSDNNLNISNFSNQLIFTPWAVIESFVLDIGKRFS